MAPTPCSDPELQSELDRLRARIADLEAALAAQVTSDEQRMHGVLQTMQEGVLLIGADWRYRYLNDVAERQGQRPKAALLGRTVMECWPGIEDTAFFRLEQRVMDERIPARIEGPYTFPDGQARWFEWKIEPVPEGLLILTSDITDRKAAAEALQDLNTTLERRVQERTAMLQATQERLQLAVQAGKVGLWDWDLHTNQVYFSPEYQHMLGYGADPFANDVSEWEQRVHPDDLGPALAKVQAYIRQPYDGYWNAFRMRHRDGTYRRIVAQATLRTDAQGQPTHMLGSHIDVTASTQAEAALRASEASYRVLFETMAQGVIVYDATGRAIMVNPTAERILGHPHADLKGDWAALSAWAIIHEDGTPLRYEEHPVRVVLGSGREVRDLVLGVTPPDGRATRWLRAQVVPQRHAGATTVERIYAIFEDITAQRAAQHALEHEGVIAAGPDGTLALINPAAMRLRDLDPAPPPTPGTDLGQTPPRLRAPEGVPFTREALPLFRNDSTARRQAEQARDEAHQQLEAIVEALDEGVIAMRADGSIVVINRSACAFMLADPAVRPRTVHELSAMAILYDPAGQPLARDELPFLRVLRGESFHHWDLKLRPARAEEERWTHMNGVNIPATNGTPALSIVSCNDITERKRADLALAAHAESLSQMNAELTRALQIKREFLTMISHELHTPLNGVLGISEGLIEEISGPLMPRQRTSLERISASARHLLEVLNDIIDLTRLDAGSIHLDQWPVEVRSLCTLALQRVAGRAQKKGMQLQQMVPEGVIEVEADERRLTQVLVNLLDNAVKFTPTGGSAGLEVVGDRAMEQIHFTVWDTGIGVAPEDLDRLFKPFSQVDGRLARFFEGTGLGLSLVRRLVDLHGGSVTLESTPGQGSRFTVTLPWTPTTSTLPLVGDARPPWDRPPHVLVADDDEGFLERSRAWLSLYGCVVLTARTGAEALEQIRTQRPALVLLDLQLPILDGLAVLQSVRADAAVAATPIIAVTGLVLPGDRERARVAGATRYLSRPVNARTLLATTAELLTGAGHA